MPLIQGSPAARTSSARDNLAYCDAYRPGSVAKIRATIPEASLHALDHQGSASWLEVEHDHWIMDGVMGVADLEKASNGKVTFEIQEPSKLAIARFAWA